MWTRNPNSNNQSNAFKPSSLFSETNNVMQSNPMKNTIAPPKRYTSRMESSSSDEISSPHARKRVGGHSNQKPGTDLSLQPQKPIRSSQMQKPSFLASSSSTDSPSSLRSSSSSISFAVRGRNRFNPSSSSSSSSPALRRQMSSSSSSNFFRIKPAPPPAVNSNRMIVDSKSSAIEHSDLEEEKSSSFHSSSSIPQRFNYRLASSTSSPTTSYSRLSPSSSSLSSYENDKFEQQTMTAKMTITASSSVSSSHSTLTTRTYTEDFVSVLTSRLSSPVAVNKNKNMHVTSNNYLHIASPSSSLSSSQLFPPIDNNTNAIQNNYSSNFSIAQNNSNHNVLKVNSSNSSINNIRAQQKQPEVISPVVEKLKPAVISDSSNKNLPNVSNGVNNQSSVPHNRSSSSSNINLSSSHNSRSNNNNNVNGGSQVNVSAGGKTVSINPLSSSDCSIQCELLPLSPLLPGSQSPTHLHSTANLCSNCVHSHHHHNHPQHHAFHPHNTLDCRCTSMHHHHAPLCSSYSSPFNTTSLNNCCCCAATTSNIWGGGGGVFGGSRPVSSCLLSSTVNSSNPLLHAHPSRFEGGGGGGGVFCSLPVTDGGAYGSALSFFQPMRRDDHLLMAATAEQNHLMMNSQHVDAGLMMDVRSPSWLNTGQSGVNELIPQRTLALSQKISELQETQRKYLKMQKKMLELKMGLCSDSGKKKRKGSKRERSREGDTQHTRKHKKRDEVTEEDERDRRKKKEERKLLKKQFHIFKQQMQL